MASGKFIRVRELPILRLRTVSLYNRSRNDDSDILIHVCDSVTAKEYEKNSSFFHTRCGRNMDYTNDVRENTFEAAVKREMGIDDYRIKFCPRCVKNALNIVEEYRRIYEEEIKFDFKRALDEKAKEEEENRVRINAWNEMIEILKTETIKIFGTDNLITNKNNSSEKYYFIEKLGRKFKISFSISEEK